MESEQELIQSYGKRIAALKVMLDEIKQQLAQAALDKRAMVETIEQYAAENAAMRALLERLQKAVEAHHWTAELGIDEGEQRDRTREYYDALEATRAFLTQDPEA